MAKTMQVKTLQLRNDNKATWEAKNPVLAKGEIGIEIDTNKFKIGNGVAEWKVLEYAGVVVAKSDTNGNILLDGKEITVYSLPMATSAILGGVKSSTGTSKVTVQEDGTLYVQQVEIAEKLSATKTFTLAGDVTGSATFDGTNNPSITTTLKNSGVIAGTYEKVTVDSQGRVTKGENLTAKDIPNITLAKVTDAGTAAKKDVGASAGNVPILDENGKLDTSVLPALALTDVFVVDSQSAMLGLTAQKGDIVIRTDVNSTFILANNPASTLENWKELPTFKGEGTVKTVNGKTGTVTLTTSDIAEGKNLYYTEARATANFNSNIAQTSSSSLKDGASIVLKEDMLTLDCGNA